MSGGQKHALLYVPDYEANGGGQKSPLTYLALEGSAEMLRTIELVRKRYGNPGLRIAMVIPTFHRRTKLAREILGTGGAGHFRSSQVAGLSGGTACARGVLP